MMYQSIQKKKVRIVVISDTHCFHRQHITCSDEKLPVNRPIAFDFSMTSLEKSTTLFNLGNKN